MTAMFQSYLILGQKEATAKKTLDLLKNLGANFAVNSPDISFIEPDKKVTSIGEVRGVKKTIHQKPFILPFKFVIFRQAQTLNKEAQNALLKLLEEPPQSAIIILEATDKSRFLPTVLSRLVTIWAETARETEGESLLKIDDLQLLQSLSSIKNPTNWLDNQMIILSEEIKTQITNGVKVNFPKVKQALELCKESKGMIESNVNPTFVLANLVLSLN